MNGPPDQHARNEPKLPSPRANGSPPATAARHVFALGVCTFVLMTPVTLIVPVLKELIGDRYQAATLWTHSFMFTNLVGAIVAAPLIAALCDHARSRVRLATVALLADGGLFAAMAAAPSLPVVLLLRSGEGVAHMLALSALMALAADRAEPNRRGRVMGVIGACMMFGTAGGTRVGGVIWKQLGPGWVFPAAAALAVVAGLLVALLVREPGRHSGVVRLRAALTLLRSDAALLLPCAYTFVERFCVGVIITSFGLFLGSTRGISPDGISRLLVMFLLPFAVCVYPAGRLLDRIGTTLPLAGGSVLFGLLFASYGWVPTAWLPAAMIASGLLSALMFAPTLSLCAALAPPAQRGTAFAAFNAAGSLGMLAGPLVGGLIAHSLESTLGAGAAYHAAFVAAGAAQVLCAAITLPMMLAMGPRLAPISEPIGRHSEVHRGILLKRKQTTLCREIPGSTSE